MYRKILVPVDGSKASLKGLDEAIKWSKALGAKLKLLHVVNEVLLDPGYAPSVYYDQMIVTLREVGRQVLADAEAIARKENVTVESELVETIGGRAADCILRAAEEWPAEMILMGTHGRRGLRRLAMGSDAELVMRQSPVPVLLVREAPES
jgi:nucleotide-binding universal stress UspA family protein